MKAAASWRGAPKCSFATLAVFIPIACLGCSHHHAVAPNRDARAVETYLKRHPDRSIVDSGRIEWAKCSPRGMTIRTSPVFLCTVHYEKAIAALCAARVEGRVTTHIHIPDCVPGYGGSAQRVLGRAHKQPIRLRHPPDALRRRAIATSGLVEGAGRPYWSEYLQFRNRIYAIFRWRRSGVCGACSAPPGMDLPHRRVFLFVFSLSTLEYTGGIGWYRTVAGAERAVARASWP